MTVYDAARTGDKRAMLEAMSDKLSQAIDACESCRDLPALTKRLMEVRAEMDALPDPKAEEQDPVAKARRKAGL